MTNFSFLKDPHDHLARITKYIPTELITFYLAIVALMPQPENTPMNGFNLWLIKLPTIAFLMLIPLWKYYSGKDNKFLFVYKSKARIFHAIAALCSFAIMAMVSINPYLPVRSIDIIGKSIIYLNPFAAVLFLVLFLLSSPFVARTVFHKK